MINPIEEIGKTTRSFFDALKDQPLSIALVLMNAMLITYLFYYTNGILTQRALTTDQIVNWQKDTDKLMANCVSKDVLETVVGALEKQLSEMRRRTHAAADSAAVAASFDPAADAARAAMNWRYVPLWRVLLFWIAGLSLVAMMLAVTIYVVSRLAHG